MPSFDLFLFAFRRCLAMLVLFTWSATGGVGCGDNSQGGASTIAEVVRSDPRLSILQESLLSSGLLETLEGAGPYTLFAPSNAALGATLEALGPEQVSSLLKYHIHRGVLPEEELKRVTAISTLSGSELHVRYGQDGVLLNDGVVVPSEAVETANGVVYVLQRALTRPLRTVTKTFENTPGLSFYNDAFDFLLLEETGYIHDIQVVIELEKVDVSTLEIELENTTTGTRISLLKGVKSQMSDVKLTFKDSALHDIVRDASQKDSGGKAFPELSYRPFQPLELLVGGKVAGEWHLKLQDLSRSREFINRLVRWSLVITIGEEPPAPAIVLDTQRSFNQPFVVEFTESMFTHVHQIGGTEEEVKMSGSIGSMMAEALTLPAGQEYATMLFPIAKSALLGPTEVMVSAERGDISRIAFFDTKITEARTKGMKLLAHLPLAKIGAPVPGPSLDDVYSWRGNDLWGWTDPVTGAEIAIMGTAAGSSFVDLSDPSAPVFLGTLPTQTVSSGWRDIKTYRDYAYIVSESEDHGMQIFDLKMLRNIHGSQRFSDFKQVGDFGSAHNLAINEESGRAYVVGSDYPGCFGGILMYDLAAHPDNPTLLGCFSGAVTRNQAGGALYPTDVYTHDLQCVIYHGPDSKYQGREICLSLDERTIGIADMSSDVPEQIARFSYENARYVHQGWLTEDHQYFLVNDEFDEYYSQQNTTSYVWDVRDLDKPVLVNVITNPSDAIGHNAYIKGDIAYQANYTSGLRLVDVSDIANGGPEVAYFDTHPEDDAIVGTCTAPARCGKAEFAGAWSVYPFFASGILLVSDMKRGLFVLQQRP